MENPHFAKIAAELEIGERQVAATALLLDDGATVPFIARYRKEATGTLDEVFITQIRDRLTQLRELDKRREAILKSIEEQGKLTDELREKIMAAQTMAELEDLYLPYKPKRRTRATIAREKGLEPLSDKIFEQVDFDLEAEAQKYIDAEKGVESTEDALAGARDIIAETVNEDQFARATIRNLFIEQGSYQAKVIPGKEDEAKKYKDYFDWTEPIDKAPSHRILAMRRAEKEMFISLSLSPEEEEALEKLRAHFITSHNSTTEQMELAVKDAYKRLLKSSMETEVRILSKKKADEEAIKVFADNLRQLLLAAPLGQKSVMGIDPAFRTGCKIVCLDQQGKLLHHDVVHPDRRQTHATETIRHLCIKYEVEAVAIGNGTASRETESFVRGIGLPPEIQIVMVNESGASVYSASPVAREEFPDHDITVRGAVSIGRRLMDPLAELVKIDPKSIGVGQYQHDVDQSQLKKSLDDVVMSCVNKVGVEVNTASKQLLTYVSGLGSQLAQNIVDFRNKFGPFKRREDLKQVPRLGEKAFEQSAGFLRIREGEQPLDASAVHPESYTVVEHMAQDLQCEVSDLIQDTNLRKKIDLKKYVSDTIGLPTLQDIVEELAKPGRDPRDTFETVQFADGVNSMEDLRPGMQLNGVITNVTNFGAFVDIGVHQDGLVHISQLSHSFVNNPNDVVKVQQKVNVRVLEVDVERKRISLSMKEEIPQKAKGGSKRKEKNQSPTQDPTASSRMARFEKKANKPQGKAKTRKEKAPDPEPESDFHAKLLELKKKFK